MSGTVGHRDLILDRLWRHANARPTDPALLSRVPSGGFAALSWAEYRDRVRSVAAACVALGVPVGGTVAVLSDNRVEWLLSALGAQAAGAMAAGVYQTSTAEQVAYILRHSEALIVVIDTPTQWRKLKPHLGSLPRLRRVVLLEGIAGLPEEDRSLAGVADPGGPVLTDWDGFLKSGAGYENAAEQRLAGLLPDQIASLIYTSGTTGDPKGVMLTHLNLSWTASCALQVHHADERDAVVSYLPLSHIAEQMFSVYLTITAGSRVYFAGGLDKLKETLIAARPTVFLAVPRVWEKLQSALQTRLSEAKPLQRRIIAWARDVGLRVGRYRLESGSPFGLLALEEKVAQKLLFNKVKTAIGLDRVRVAVSGAAAIRKDVLDFFLSLGLPIYEVYGQSECAGPSTSNASKPGETRLGTVGRAIPGGSVKLAEDGEILFQGPNLFAGYYKDPAATAATIQDGWLHTGDVGELDDRGFLRITDRKKDLFKTSGGKYIAPQPLEGLLRAIPIIGQAVIVGENRRYVTALLTLDPDKAAAFAKERGLTPAAPGSDPGAAPAAAPPADRSADPALDLGALTRNEKVLAFVQEHVDRINKSLARYETVKRFTLLPRDFSIDRDEMTPSQKLRRRVILTRYAREIEAMYPPDAEPASEG